jgi:Rps23 Pro-64 3,4-dihydroxylase Tpa1-like proline 4-hydroxylase
MKIQKFNTPFNHILIENFFQEKTLIEFEHILKTLEYKSQSCDLYEFTRSEDLTNFSKTNTIINSFVDKLKIFEESFNMKLNKNFISIHSLILKKTDYLLVHDDKVEKRKIAFILNLSTLSKNEKEKGEDDGGCLNLYDKNLKKVKSIYPKRGNLVAFEVSKDSFHSISEVKKDITRLTIGGWFY